MADDAKSPESEQIEGNHEEPAGSGETDGSHFLDSVKEDDRIWNRIAHIFSRAITPTRLTLLFLTACWLLLRFVYIKSGANLDVRQLVEFTSSIFTISLIFYFVLLSLKLVLFVIVRRNVRECYLPWILFAATCVVCLVSFEGFILAGRSIFLLATESERAAIGSLQSLLESYKFIPAIPVVVGVFSSVIPWSDMPQIQALNLPFVISVCIGLTVLGLYSYFWKFLPRHLSLSAILLGAISTGVLIFYLSTPAAQSPAVHGKLLIRVMVSILLTCGLLAVYMEYWKEAVRKFPATSRSKSARDPRVVRTSKDGSFLRDIADMDLRLIFLPPGHGEVGLWLFFGLVVVGDMLEVHLS